MADLTRVVVIAITAFPATIAAIAGLIVSLRNSKKADEIHVLVNGNMLNVKEQLTAANLEISDLRAHVIELTGLLQPKPSRKAKRS